MAGPRGSRGRLHLELDGVVADLPGMLCVLYPYLIGTLLVLLILTCAAALWLAWRLQEQLRCSQMLAQRLIASERERERLSIG